MATKRKAIVPPARRRPGAGRKSKPHPKRSVQVPKSREPKTRVPRRPAPREGWLRWWQRMTKAEPIPVVDPILDWSTWLLTPDSRPWHNDPRKRSRNLGHVVDGLTGWAADVIGHVPVVGRLCRPVVRVGAMVVRGAEDAVNLVTSPFGFGIFLLCLLSVIGTAEGVDHWCEDSQRITNCCSPREITFCTETMCWHKHGCVPCTTDGCWTPVGVNWSVRNISERTDLWFHTDWLAGIVYTCDTLELGEVCSVVAILAEVAMENLQYHHTLVCNLTCFMFTDPKGSFPWFFEFVAQDLSWLRVMFGFVQGAPQLLAEVLSGGATVSFLVMVAYALQGKLAKATLLFFLLAYARGDTTWRDEPTVVCGPTNQYDGTALCFTPVPYIVAEGGFLPPGTRGCVWHTDWTYRSSKKDTRSLASVGGYGGGFDYNKFVTYLEIALQRWVAEGMPELNFTRDLAKASKFQSCYVPTKKRLSGGCSSWFGNLSAGDTWEDCGKGMWLTECAVVHTVFDNETWNKYPLWAEGKRFWVAVDESDGCKAKNWTLRLPGSPDLVSFNLAQRPALHHFRVGEAASGYLQFSTDGKYQVVAGGRVLSPFPHLHDTVLLFCFCVIVGARWTPFLVAAWALYSAEAAVVEVLGPAALTASCPQLLPFAWYLGYWPASLLLLVAAPFYAGKGVMAYLFCALVSWCSLHSQALAYECEAWGGAFPLILGCIAVFFPYRKVWRAAGFWATAYTRERFTLAVCSLASELQHARFRLLLLSAIFPDVTFLVCFSVFLFVGLVDSFLACLENFWVSRMSVYGLSQTLLNIYQVLGGPGVAIARWLLRVGGKHGLWLYDHLGEVDPRIRAWLSGSAVWYDPILLQETEVRYIQDSAGRVACGDTIEGLPVVARLGELVMCGWNSEVHMEGWRLLAPFRADMTRHTGFFKTISLALTGRDTRQARGQIAVLGTGLKGCMGFGYGGALVSCYHGTRGKTLATPGGPMQPLSINASDDVSLYPLPAGMTSLPQCSCNPTELWCFDKFGGLHRGELRDGVMHLTAPVPLSSLKGASGSPIMCNQAHAVGVLKSAGHVRGVACKINFVQLSKCTAVATVVPDSTSSHPPPVPKDFEIRILHAPTGSGKTTKIPMGYVAEGYNTLVLNPSVATTLSMGPYMLKQYNIAPSIHTGESSTGTGTKLTYATYGKAVAMNTSLLDWADVIICDECHDTTAPTLLGIGHVLMQAEARGVKLVLLATATPPGCATTKHPMITEVALGTSGEIPYYGRKLEAANYKTGRHLVFFTSKALCETNANLFRSLGIHAVAYYRGVPPTVINFTGDVVVCATDALMTGYTGDFDSVTDCNLSVNLDLEIDLNPTFSIALRTNQANAVTRMQRRGRTGRGKPGIYRYCDEGEACSGIVPDSSVLEAYDMAYAWYRMTAGDTQALLETYAKTPGLPVINTDLEMWASFVDALSPNPGILEKVKLTVENFATITAAQWDLSNKMKAPLPGSDGRWKGGKVKEGKCPLICHLDCDKNQEWDDSAPLIQTLAAVLGIERDEATSGWHYLVAGAFGLGLAVAVDATSSLVVVGSVSINQAYVNTIPADVLYDLDGHEAEECGMDLLSVKEAFGGLYLQLKQQAEAMKTTLQAYADSGLNSPVVPEASSDSIVAILNSYLSEIISGASLATGLFTIRNNAPLACCHAFVAGLVSVLPVQAKCMIAMVAGAVASTLTHTKPACAFVAAGMVGAGIAGLSLTSVFTSIFSGYAGATAGANVTYRILSGEVPSMEDLLGLLGGAFNPGAVVAGVVVAIVLKRGIADRSPDWTNRLLAMLSKTNVLPPNYFLETDTLASKIGKLLQDLTPIKLFHKVVQWLETPDTTPCGVGVLADFVRGVYRILASILEWLKSHIPLPNFGMLSCDTPYKGDWAGNGTVHTKCSCGNMITVRVEGGLVTPAAVPYKCWTYWKGGVPINGSTVFKGTVPTPKTWKVGVVLIGWNMWYEVSRLQGTYYVTGVSTEIIEIPPGVPTEFAYVDGVRVAQHCGKFPTLIRDRATINGLPYTFPVSLDKLAWDSKKGEKEKAHEELKKSTPQEKMDYLKLALAKEDPDLDPKEAKKVGEKRAEIRKRIEANPAAALPWQCKAPFTKKQLEAKNGEVPPLGEPVFLTDKIAVKFAMVDGALTLHEDTISELVEKDLKMFLEGEALLAKVAKADADRKSQGLSGPYSLKSPSSGVGSMNANEKVLDWFKRAPSFDSISIDSRPRVWLSEVDKALEDLEMPTSVPTRGGEVSPVQRGESPDSLCTPTQESVPVVPAAEVVSAIVHAVADSATAVARKVKETVHPKPKLPARENPCAVEMDNLELEEWESGSEEITIGDVELAPITTETTDCSWSYVWNGVPISTRQVGKLFTPIRYLASGLGRARQLVYYSSPASAEERKAKVTYWRQGEVDKVLLAVRNRALVAVSTLGCRGMTFQEAARLTPPRSATSHLSGLTAKEVRSESSKARNLCTEAFNSIGDPSSKYCCVTVMPKVEIFVKTPEKPTMKPARLIAYPPLEMRVAEKMVLGNVAPAAVKKVLGEAYGFQYTPWERVRKLVDWWQSKRQPMAFACDTVCFDSTVTPEDVSFETEVYAAATKDPNLKAKIFGLGGTLYTSSPMYNQNGQLLGTRHCRASGVFTTSSSNCLTAFTKATAAAYHAGIKGLQLLVHGDDIIGICESSGSRDDDANALRTFSVWMKKYGCPQGDAIEPCYSLEDITSCSSNVSMAKDLLTGKPYYFLTRDPLVPLGRAMAESFDRNVAATWVGNIILHYPAIWASRVLMVHWLNQIETLSDVPTDIVIDIWGTEYTISIWVLPYLIERLHGEAARRCAYYTPAEVQRVSARLKLLGYPPLSAWKKKARELRVRMLRRGGGFAYLAHHFLWFSVRKLPPPINPLYSSKLVFKLPTFQSPEGYLRQQLATESFGGIVQLSLLLLTISLLLTFVYR
nr:polyprotein [Rodent hepacivirus]